MAEIVIYTKSYDPYSKACKEWLEEKNLQYTEKVVDNDKDSMAEMVNKSGDRTDTPQVFVNGHHIGSFDDLKAFEVQGGLDDTLTI